MYMIPHDHKATATLKVTGEMLSVIGFFEMVIGRIACDEEDEEDSHKTVYTRT